MDPNNYPYYQPNSAPYGYVPGGAPPYDQNYSAGNYYPPNPGPGSFPPNPDPYYPNSSYPGSYGTGGYSGAPSYSGVEGGYQAGSYAPPPAMPPSYPDPNPMPPYPDPSHYNPNPLIYGTNPAPTNPPYYNNNPGTYSTDPLYNTNNPPPTNPAVFASNTTPGAPLYNTSPPPTNPSVFASNTTPGALLYNTNNPPPTNPAVFASNTTPGAPFYNTNPAPGVFASNTTPGAPLYNPTPTNPSVFTSNPTPGTPLYSTNSTPGVPSLDPSHYATSPTPTNYNTNPAPNTDPTSPVPNHSYPYTTVPNSITPMDGMGLATTTQPNDTTATTSITPGIQKSNSLSPNIVSHLSQLRKAQSSVMGSHKNNEPVLHHSPRGSATNLALLIKKHFPKVTEISTERQSLTMDELLKRKQEAVVNKGFPRLLIDETLRNADQGEESYMAKLMTGDSMIRLDGSSRVSVKCFLTEDWTTMCHGESGFIFLKFVQEIKKKGDNIFGLKYGPLWIDFETQNDVTFEMWTIGLVFAIKKCKKITTFYEYLQMNWTKNYKLGDSIEYDDTRKLIENMIESKFVPEEVKFSTLFPAVDKNHDGKIQFSEFVELMRRIVGYPHLEHVFNKYSTNDLMDAPQLQKFFIEVQKETQFTIERAEHIIRVFSPNGKQLDFYTFTEFLNDPYYNHAFDYDSCGYVYQDMRKPLSHYFISSSHNTYCSSDQLKGKASIEMYARALRDGCRCVELDIWDGSNRPVILHGNTLMKSVDFYDVLCCIKENAFVTSKYPLVLSLENHCSRNMQEMMVADFRKVLGDYIVEPTGNITQLPSPEELCYKILLKGPISASYYEELEGGDKKGIPDKICESLTKMTYLRSTHMSSLANASKNPYEMSSFDEVKIEKYAKAEATDMIKFCRIQMARVYPKGLRVDSSNYSPIASWNMGCQLVALNWQTLEEPMWLNLGKFKDNGGCGFVLKPPIMTESSHFDFASNPSYFQNKNPNSTYGTFVVHVLGARFLPSTAKKGFMQKTSKPIISVKLFGITENQEEKGVVDKSHDFLVPHWDNKWKFHVKMSEMAILLFTVLDKSAQTKIASCCLPLKGVRLGYRVLPLKNANGVTIPFSSVFVNFSWE